MFKQEVGKRIRKIREEKGITREQLADRIDITTKFLYEIENGKKGMSANTLLKVAKELSCTCDYLLCDVNSRSRYNSIQQIEPGMINEFDEKQSEIINEILYLLFELK